MPSDPVKVFPFLFYLYITSGTETRKERSSQTRKGRKRERKNDSQTQWPNLRRNGEIVPLSSCRRSLSFSISLSLLNRVWSSQHRTDRDLAFAPITISPSRQSQSKHHAVRSRLSPNPITSLSSFFSQFDRIWWYFFLSFVCVSILRNEWYYIFVWQLRKCEKMWATSRKCVFYGIFKNTTKH